MTDSNPDPVVAIVPLMIEEVIIGKVVIDDNNHLSIDVMTPSTQSYLKEMLLVHRVRCVSLDIDYVEPPINQAPSRGHLRIVREY